MMAWRVVRIPAGELFVILQDQHDATDAEADGCMADGAAAVARVGIERVLVLVLTDGGAYTPSQRSRLRELFGGERHLRTAVMTATIQARLATRAHTWSVPSTAAFAIDEVEPWLAHLSLTPADAAVARRELSRLQHAVHTVGYPRIEPFLAAFARSDR